MRLQLRTAGGAAVTAALGAMLLRLALGGLDTRYVRPAMRPYLVASAVVLLLMAVGTLLRGRGEHPSHDGHDHAPGTAPRAGLLLLLPLVAVFLVAPPALGSWSAGRSATVQGRLTAPAPLPSARDGAVDLTLRDFLDRTASGQDLTVGRYRLVGFVTADPSRTPGRFFLTRLVVACCAADAQSVQVAVVGAPDIPREGGWVTVVGTEVLDGQGQPALQALELTPEKEPRDPYEQP